MKIHTETIRLSRVPHCCACAVICNHIGPARLCPSHANSTFVPADDVVVVIQ